MDTFSEEFHEKVSLLAEDLSRITGKDIIIAVADEDGECITSLSGDFEKPKNAYAFCGASFALSKSLLGE